MCKVVSGTSQCTLPLSREVAPGTVLTVLFKAGVPSGPPLTPDDDYKAPLF